MSDVDRTTLIADLRADMAPVLTDHMVGDDLVIPLTTHVATAHR